MPETTLPGSEATGEHGPISEPLYEAFCSALADLGAMVQRGTFGADMAVSLVNDGPVTMIVEG